MSTWSAFLVFDREVDSFSCYDGEVVDTSSKSAFKVTPLGWNAESKGGNFYNVINPKNGDCAIFYAKNISCVKYFSWPDFTRLRGLMDRTCVYNTRGRES